MTRSPQGNRPGDPGDPRKSGRSRPAVVSIAAVVSIIGLMVIAVATLSISTGTLPISLGGNGGHAPGATDDPRVLKTPTPVGVVVVPTESPGMTVPGTLVYAKDGNVWLQSNGTATQLTNGGGDSMPSFSQDGQAVYFIRVRAVNGQWPAGGAIRQYNLVVPTVMRVPVTGGDATAIYDGLIDPAGRLKYMGFIRQPVVSPNGATLALTTDMPDPTHSDVTLKLLDLKSKKLTDLHLPEVAPLGHQDPAWRPDGAKLAYVLDDRDGATGTPKIYLYSVDTKKTRALTGPGYIHPSWSPDGRYITATKTDQFGTDVVILDATSGAELLRLTNDGNSWAPTWSPAGDQIAFLHVEGKVVDLQLIQLQGVAPNWTAKDPIDLTTDAGLDSISRPDWFVPADQMPAVTAAPVASPAAPSSTAPSASPSGS
jgi:hypothetical protein